MADRHATTRSERQIFAHQIGLFQELVDAKDVVIGARGRQTDRHAG